MNIFKDNGTFQSNVFVLCCKFGGIFGFEIKFWKYLTNWPQLWAQFFKKIFHYVFNIFEILKALESFKGSHVNTSLIDLEIWVFETVNLRTSPKVI